MSLEGVLTDIMRTVRRLRNDLALVHRLPTEILSAVFQWTQVAAADNARTSIRISHVCQRWRDTAIGLQQLWSKIKISPGGPPAARDVFLERSGNAPLAVEIQISDPEWISHRVLEDIPRQILLLGTYCERILSIDIDAPDSLGSLLSNLTFRVPRLRRFACRRRLSRNSPVQSAEFPPGSLFQGHVPSIREVEMTDVRWAPILVITYFKNLTDLRLYSHGPDAWKINILFDIVEGSPLLERLEIRRYQFATAESDRSSVALPELKLMKLEATNSRLILSSLELPHTLELYIVDPIGSYLGNPIHPFLPDDPSLLPIPSRSTELELSIGDPGTHRHYFSFGGKSANIILDLNNNENGTVATTWNYLSMIVTTLKNLTSLTIHYPGHTPPSPDAVHAFFANLPSLQILHLEQEHSDFLIRPFIDGYDLCPNLRRIIVTVSIEGCRETFGVIKDVFQAREAIGRPIRVNHYVVEADNDVTQRWDKLCEEHHLPRR
jgi:hypothetical protein